MHQHIDHIKDQPGQSDAADISCAVQDPQNLNKLPALCTYIDIPLDALADVHVEQRVHRELRYLLSGECLERPVERFSGRGQSYGATMKKRYIQDDPVTAVEVVTVLNVPLGDM